MRATKVYFTSRPRNYGSGDYEIVLCFAIILILLHWYGADMLIESIDEGGERRLVSREEEFGSA